MLAEKPEARPWDGDEVAALAAGPAPAEKVEAEVKAEAEEKAPNGTAALEAQAQQEAEERASREGAAPRPRRVRRRRGGPGRAQVAGRVDPAGVPFGGGDHLVSRRAWANTRLARANRPLPVDCHLKLPN